MTKNLFCFCWTEGTPGRCEFEDFRILNVLGECFFGVRYTERGVSPLAVQIIGEQCRKKKKIFAEEIKAARALDCEKENVVKILAFCTYTDPLSILMDKMTLTVEGEDLSNLYMYLIYLRKKFEAGIRWNVLRNKELFSFVKQIAKGMKFLEENNIIHGDLMTRNILINNCRTLKISNFDFLKTKKIKDGDRNCLSTYISRRWAAPETISLLKHSNLSDVWSFGVVIWEIGTLGGFPLPHLSDRELLEILETDNPWWSDIEILYKKMIPENFSTELYYFTEQCWFQLDKRPTFRSLYDELNETFPYENAFKDFDSLPENFSLAPTIDDFVEKKAMKTVPQLENFHERSKHLKELGKGNFGQVDLMYSFKELLGHKTVVLKTMTIENDKMSLFETEKQKLEQLEEHENLVRILAFSWTATKISIISEYVAVNTGESVMPNLHVYLLKLREVFKIRHFVKIGGQPRVSTPSHHIELGSFAFQIAKGMAYLENQQLGHGNLSAKNVLVSYYKTVKISDYGLPPTTFLQGVFSEEFRRWAAPEVLGGNYSIKSDVWTFGVVLWEIATLGAYPYGDSNRDLDANGAKFRPEKPKYYEIDQTGGTTYEFPAIFDRCLNDTALNRPSFEDLVKDLQNYSNIFCDFMKIPLESDLPLTKKEIPGNLETQDQNQSIEVSSPSHRPSTPTSQPSSPVDISPPSAKEAKSQKSATSAKIQIHPTSTPKTGIPNINKLTPGKISPIIKATARPSYPAGSSHVRRGILKPAKLEIKNNNSSSTIEAGKRISFSGLNSTAKSGIPSASTPTRVKIQNQNPTLKVTTSISHTPSISIVKNPFRLESSKKKPALTTPKNVPRTNPNVSPPQCPNCGKSKGRGCFCFPRKSSS